LIHFYKSSDLDMNTRLLRWVVGKCEKVSEAK